MNQGDGLGVDHEAIAAFRAAIPKDMQSALTDDEIQTLMKNALNLSDIEKSVASLTAEIEKWNRSHKRDIDRISKAFPWIRSSPQK